MKIIMLCGSPRPKDSNSLYLLEGLKEKLGSDNKLLLLEASKEQPSDLTALLAEQLQDCGAFVVAFPLYVDGIPSSLLGILKELERLLPAGRKSVFAYAVVNCGFYEAVQTRTSIRMFWKWCEKCGFQRGRAVGVGAGEMSKAAPMGHGPAANLGRALESLAADILAGRSADTLYVEPNFPRFLYKLAAHTSWRSAARKNGIPLSGIKRGIP